MEDFIFQKMVVRVYPIIGALRVLAEYEDDISKQREIAEEYFEYLEKNNIMQNSDTKYYRENIWRLFDIVEVSQSKNEYGRPIIFNSFRIWSEHGFYNCFVLGGGKYPGMIEDVHTDEFENSIDYEGFGGKSSKFRKYKNEKSRYISAKVREYRGHMENFLSERKENEESFAKNKVDDLK